MYMPLSIIPGACGFSVRTVREVCGAQQDIPGVQSRLRGYATRRTGVQDRRQY